MDDGMVELNVHYSGCKEFFDAIFDEWHA